MLKATRETYEVIAGFCMMLVGFLLPFLMVVGVIASSIGLSIFSYAISLAGLALGLHGVYGIYTTKRGNEEGRRAGEQ
ncbi:MAG: hypothetical protein QFX33_00605 [Candidatus Nezhaarchaeota archaeon]|nr:hypothetical protein [Candidatus Nezhaarchaeota archaeon]